MVLREIILVVASFLQTVLILTADGAANNKYCEIFYEAISSYSILRRMVGLQVNNELERT
jgi:hypothetical protein